MNSNPISILNADFLCFCFDITISSSVFDHLALFSNDKLV